MSISETRFGTSPVGNRSRRDTVCNSRQELMETFNAFIAQEPTRNEMEMIDTLMSAFMWSYLGYKEVFKAAMTAHEVIHKETASWQLKPRK